MLNEGHSKRKVGDHAVGSRNVWQLSPDPTCPCAGTALRGRRRRKIAFPPGMVWGTHITTQLAIKVQVATRGSPLPLPSSGTWGGNIWLCVLAGLERLKKTGFGSCLVLGKEV